MVSATSLSKQQLATKLVQEIAKMGDQVPENFLIKDGIPKAIDTPNMWRNNLLIDISLLTSATPASSSELAKLRSALSDWGCFMVVNHGTENSFLEELIDVVKQFFALPLEEKLKSSGSDDIYQGYGNDRAHLDLPTAASWHDRIFLTLHPHEKKKLQFWPSKSQNFTGMLEKYTSNLRTLNDTIYKAMAKSLNLEENCFLKKHGTREEMMGKFSLYPPCPRPDQVLGFGKHTDGTTITVILAENDVEGLEVMKDDQWYKVPIIPGSLFVNLGDFGEVMSNGVFKSAVHRVVTNTRKSRISVVVSSNPENNNEIGPVNECVTIDKPQMFRKFSINEYRKIYFDSFALGRSALVSMSTYSCTRKLNNIYLTLNF